VIEWTAAVVTHKLFDGVNHLPSDAREHEAQSRRHAHTPVKYIAILIETSFFK
jgi:hypothetical protein